MKNFMCISKLNWHYPQYNRLYFPVSDEGEGYHIQKYDNCDNSGIKKYLSIVDRKVIRSKIILNRVKNEIY